jgi:hypothetical protein
LHLPRQCPVIVATAARRPLRPASGHQESRLPQNGACTDFCVTGNSSDVNRGKGDSRNFADTKIGTVPQSASPHSIRRQVGRDLQLLRCRNRVDSRNPGCADAAGSLGSLDWHLHGAAQSGGGKGESTAKPTLSPARKTTLTVLPLAGCLLVTPNGPGTPPAERSRASSGSVPGDRPGTSLAKCYGLLAGRSTGVARTLHPAIRA